MPINWRAQLRVAAPALLLGTALVALPPAQADPGSWEKDPSVATDRGSETRSLLAPSTRPVKQLLVRYAPGAKATSDEAVMGSSSVSSTRLESTSRLVPGLMVVHLAQPVSADVAEQAARELSEDPRVEFAEADLGVVPTSVTSPDDPFLASQWPLSGIFGVRPTAGWQRSTGSGVVVAVVDNGIAAHPELVGRTVPGYDMITDPTTANDGGGRDANPADPGDWTPGFDSSWHGTHVAGTIAALSDNGTGMTGLAQDARVQPVRVLGTGGGSSADVIAGINWAAGLPVSGVPANATPAKVINMSLGNDAPGPCPASFQTAIDAAVGAGVTVVVAAGNAADEAEYYPANCNNVVVVAASGPTGQYAWYSNFGPNLDLAAPGGDQDFGNAGGVLSTVNAGTQGPTTPTFAYYQGTSMAAPHVSAAAALLLATSPGMTPAQVEDRLKATAYDSGCDPNDCGAGLLDVSALVPAVAPSAPAAVTAAGRDGALKVSWARPPTTGGSIIDYTATARSAAAAGTVLGTCTTAALTCSIDGLTNDSNHFVEVVARNATGTGPANAPRVVGVPNALSTGLFSPLSPARLLDTRVTGPAIGPAGTRSVQVTGVGGVPASGVTAVVVNVTAVAPTATGHLTAFPNGTTRPTASSLNFAAGRTTGNLVTVKVGSGGIVNLYNNSGTIHAVVDVAGYFTEATPAGSVYSALSPARLLDTRITGPALGPAGIRNLDVTGVGGVPASDVTAVVINTTAVAPTSTGHVTAYPNGDARPNASSLNFGAGSTTGNLAIVKVGADGTINFFNNSGTTHLVVDVAGYFTDVSAASIDGTVYTALAPARLLDTRQAAPAIGQAGNRALRVTGVGGVPASGVTAVVVNITAVAPTATGHVTVYPAGTTRPNASSLNFTAGRTTGNLVVVKVGADGKINLFNNSGTTNAVVDVAGWFG